VPTEDDTAPAGDELTLVDLVLTIDNAVATVGGANVPLDAAPFIADGRTMVPFRFIGEALGAEVDWDADTRTAYFTDGATVVGLTIGEALYDDEGDYMGTPTIVDGRTFVPVRFVVVSMGATIEWDGAARTVTIPVPTA
jgi:hypothetical protein